MITHDFKPLCLHPTFAQFHLHLHPDAGARRLQQSTGGRCRACRGEEPFHPAGTYLVNDKRNAHGSPHKSFGVAQCLPLYPPGSTRGSLERRKPVRDAAGLPGEAWAGCASGGEEVFSSRNLFVSYLDLSLRMPPPHSPPGPLHS